MQNEGGLTLELHAVRLSFLTTKETIRSYLQYVSPVSRSKIERFMRIEDAIRSLAAELLARIVLCRALECSNRDLSAAWHVNAHGKPYLHESKLHFNLSHAGHWVVLAVDNARVGVDIERINPIDLDIAKRYFSKIEYSDLMAIPSDRRLDYFYTLWKLKEAYIKADGRGLAVPLDSFSFREIGQGISLQPHEQENATFKFKQYEIDELYKLSVCAEHSSFPTDIVLWDEKSILQDAGRLL